MPIEWQETKSGMEYAPTPDKLWRTAPLPLRARYAVMGVPLEVATNAPCLAAQAAEVFGEWGAPSTPESAGVKRLHVYLHDVPDTFRPDAPSAALTRMQQDYFLLSAGNSLGFADPTAGFACAFLTPTLAAASMWAQVCFLECLGIYLVCRERPITLHAAAVIHQSRCVLLTGADGAGKSTLAYACLRAGFQLLAEDIVFARAPESPLEVWGNPWNIHLLPDAVRFFPELANAPRVQQLNGETKFRIRVCSLRPEAPVPRQKVWGVCSLGRASGVGTHRLPAEAAHIRRALTTFKGDPPLDRPAMEQAADGLLGGNLAHFEIGSDLEEAVATLRRWIETA